MKTTTMVIALLATSMHASAAEQTLLCNLEDGARLEVHFDEAQRTLHISEGGGPLLDFGATGGADIDSRKISGTTRPSSKGQAYFYADRVTGKAGMMLTPPPPAKEKIVKGRCMGLGERKF